MFDQASGLGHPMLDELFERRCPTVTPEAAALIERVAVAARRENRDAAARLAAIAGLFALRLSRCSETEYWAVDTMDAVAAEVAAALNISHALACAQVRLARALREQLPQVGAVFAAGDIDARLFADLVHRTGLIVDPEILARVDGQLAASTARLTPLSRGRLARYVDRIIARVDPDAVRRRKDSAQRREVWITDRLDGMSDFGGSLFTTTAHALDQRLDHLSATVCDADPRTKDQRRADAMDALIAKADRIPCQCGDPECAAAEAIASPVVLNVITDPSVGEGVLLGADGLLPAELVATLATGAKHRPLIPPVDREPDPNYAPSRTLARFVRCRDLTCRFPGCERPAMHTDLDHTVAHADGGPTAASNLACLCRTHHLLKTFGGWRDVQLRDGTLIWVGPAGDTYVTTPGSALLFPALCTPTPAVSAGESRDHRGRRTANMPVRRRTRDQNRASRIAAERAHNQQMRQSHRRRRGEDHHLTATTSPDPDDPPPF
ncbi:DUF222 domain-containing protein [Mycolicibacterium sp. S2-37]|uniref:HNH endonuclease signature motif containing protein n=1 Tax=Mycolicibacterium sp. S2-37 TaxID=2810297 RepID=UPI001A94A47A|nr:HNH endonuclease signature motif containing protein [Mycolicibacterium sp. S2-37]MBO0677831.1 DUF222 domain-containing protein [Mycolicibacterium sp. S2-37]